MKTDILVVGSGVGGATVARQLAIRGRKATILEKGRYRKLGTERRAAELYSGEKCIEGTEIFRGFGERLFEKLDKGDEISREILLQAGASPKSFYTTRVRGAHPGGTAGIGRVVNTDHETEISRLFVSDASVLHKAPGAPPVLTIVALSKRFSKKLSSEYL